MEKIFTTTYNIGTDNNSENGMILLILELPSQFSSYFMRVLILILLILTEFRTMKLTRIDAQKEH